MYLNSQVIDNKGKLQETIGVYVENILREQDDNGVEVFNFKVDEYHTYYVGENCILVHNADYMDTTYDPRKISQSEYDDLRRKQSEQYIVKQYIQQV